MRMYVATPLCPLSLLSLSCLTSSRALLTSATAGAREDLDLRRRVLDSTATATGVLWLPTRKERILGVLGPFFWRDRLSVPDIRADGPHPTKKVAAHIPPHSDHPLMWLALRSSS